MTTIALRDGVMVSDGKGSCDDLTIEFNGAKISVSVKHQFIAGQCGDPSEATKILRALERCDRLPWDHLGAELALDMENTGLIIAHKDGRVIHIQSKGWFETGDESFYAIGSGTPVALGAFHMGATAEQAIEAACIFDNNSGGKARSFALEDIPPATRQKPQEEGRLI